MTLREVLYLVKKNMGRLFMAGFLIAVIIVGLFIWNTKKFESTTDFLIVQSGVQERDLYSLSKSAEYIGNVLSDAIYSDLFIDEAIKLNRFDNRQFLPDPMTRLDEWKKVVSVRRNFQSSIITIQVKGNDGLQILSVSKAIAQVMAEKNQLFRAGGASELQVKVISGPRIERRPSLTQVVAVAGFIAGVLILGSSIVFSYEMRKTLRASQVSVPISA